MLQNGQVFNNRYKIISTLGEGGFGAVYKVWDDNLQRNCAIKENLQVSPEAQKQFKREAIMLANLNHQHLVRVTDYFFIADQGQYLVMDFVDGNDLQTILTDNGGPLPTEQALAWIRQVCDALIYIHNQNPPIIHRDIKPANIRVTPQGNAVLVDFGLAKTFDVGMKTSMGARGLTPHFAAPEQYGMGGTDAQSDIYSLGVTLYCLLTYSVPPDSVEIMVGNADPPSPAKELQGNISDSVSDALQCAMQIRRTERYKSVTNFKKALSVSAILSQSTVKMKDGREKEKEDERKQFNPARIEWIQIPAGEFLYGENGAAPSNQYQKKLIIENPFEIGKYPITQAQYQLFIDANPTQPVPFMDWRDSMPYNWDKQTRKHPAGKENHPVVLVSWSDAQVFCKWANCRLPTQEEWEKAARGTDGRPYPWGNQKPDSNLCNFIENENGTTAIDKYSPRGDSPYGCVDMLGNVLEWTASVNTRNNPIMRGGSWISPFYEINSSVGYTEHSNYRDHLIGFRCARSLP